MISHRRTRSLILLPGAILGLAAGAVNSGPAQSAPSDSPYRLTATVQDLMVGIIDPSADVVWNSVAYVAMRHRIEDRQPRTDAEWQAVRYSAITLIEAANLLSMPGRRVVAAHGATVEGGSKTSDELPYSEIQQRIDSSHGVFTQFARNLQDAATRALTAVDARDARGLMNVGSVIDQACDDCHMTYWYPSPSSRGQ